DAPTAPASARRGGAGPAPRSRRSRPGASARARRSVSCHADALSIEFVLLHLCNETARHAGHADATRELLDGTAGE
ncbi:MAG TPA: DUF664 domain-containing protein, partial [Acidimicrobiia bacterium]|nr:DUF664 domain-containing protein [Acidimicrobiia bacterium]